MNHVELIGGTLAYASTTYALGLVSWAVAKRALPPGTRVGLRLAAVLLGQFVGCAILVQSLGLIGQFRSIPYMAVSLGAGAVVSWVFRKDRPHRSLWRLVRDTLNLWLNKTPLGMGYVSAMVVLFATYRFFAYVRSMDSLTIHGPLVVKWIQRGRIELTSNWNYPQCWEYQYAPNFLFLRSDVLVVVPGLLLVAVLFLLIREVASRLRIPGKIASLLSLLSVLNPVIWGGTMKNDPAFAGGLLMSFLALERVARGRKGALWLAQVGAFMVLGSKATGLAYAGLVLGLFVTIRVVRGWKQPYLWRDLARLFLLTFVFQASAVAVQANNFVQRGNPTYPIKLKLGPVVFDGPGDLTGTSLLEAAGKVHTWLYLFKGSIYQVGLDLPFLFILLVSASFFGAVLMIRDLVRGRRPEMLYVLAISTSLLWILYLATPWSRGSQSDPLQYVRHGHSLRYAIGPICFSYVVSAAFLLRIFGRQKVYDFVSSTFLALVFAKWFVRSVWHGPVILVMWKLLVVFVLLCGSAWLAALLWRISGRLPALVRDTSRVVVSFCLAAAALSFYAQRVEKGRPWKWEQPHQQLWKYVRNQLPSGVTIGSNSKEPLRAYFLLGAQLNNRIRYVPFRLEGEPLRVPEIPDYYYLFFRSEKIREQALGSLEQLGWQPLVRSADQRGILLRHPRLSAAETAPEVR